MLKKAKKIADQKSEEKTRRDIKVDRLRKGKGGFWGVGFLQNHTHIIHAWYIYLHLVDVYEYTMLWDRKQ